MAKGSHSAAVADDKVSPAILMLSSTAAVFLPFFPFRRPASGGLISTDHAFVVSVLFAFTCSFSAVFLETKPRPARVFKLSAALWLSSAVALLFYAVCFNRLCIVDNFLLN